MKTTRKTEVSVLFAVVVLCLLSSCKTTSKFNGYVEKPYHLVIPDYVLKETSTDYNIVFENKKSKKVITINTDAPGFDTNVLDQSSVISLEMRDCDTLQYSIVPFNLWVDTIAIMKVCQQNKDCPSDFVKISGNVTLANNNTQTIRYFDGNIVNAPVVQVGQNNVYNRCFLRDPFGFVRIIFMLNQNQWVTVVFKKERPNKEEVINIVLTDAHPMMGNGNNDPAHGGPGGSNDHN